MKCVKFTLSGRMAHFKNPENNIFVELTYNNIHKPALLGILGAILGLKGRNQFKELGYLEYYEHLKDIKCAIVPKSPYFKKHIEEINNSSGLANAGMSQQIRKQMLLNPSWDIFLIKSGISDHDWEFLIKYLSNGESKFSLGLGGKKQIAAISNYELIEIDKADIVDNCDSLILSEDVLQIINERDYKYELDFELREMHPVSLNEKTLYNKKEIIYTSNKMKISNKGNIYNANKLKIYFY